MASDNSPSPSEDDDDEFADDSRKSSSPQEVSFEGTLSKWTNYIHGWQNRHVVLQNGTLSYYKSESDTAYGCRGSVSLAKAKIEIHEFDECRFDVNVNDCIYHLRCVDTNERQKWIAAIEKSKLTESGYGSETHLPKVGSMLSLVSAPSLQSSSSFKKGHGLKEKLMEIETFRDILCRQVDTLQSYFDMCADKSPDSHSLRLDMNDDDDEEGDELLDELAATPTPANSGFMKQAKLSDRNSDGSELPLNFGVDFRGEAITFKATTAGILAILSHCVEVMSMRDDQWRVRLDKEKDRRKRLEEKYKQALESAHKKSFLMSGPDYMEGPHSKLNEDEFYDAVETALDREDEEEELIQRTKSELKTPASSHRFSEQIEKTVKDCLILIKEPTDTEGSTWELVFEDGEMMVYRKESEIDGIVCDPLKASHLVEGVSGHEMCHYFFDIDVRMDWETTVEKVRLLETLADSSIIFNQIHKRIWPSSQRDTCFVSHLQDVSKEQLGSDFTVENQIGKPWMVTNFSVEHDDAPNTKYLRALATIIMFCQTIIRKGADLNNLKREDVSCRLTYSAQVNPGGWAPPAVVRSITKREYPKFLRRFSAFVQETTADKPVML